MSISRTLGLCLILAVCAPSLVRANPACEALFKAPNSGEAAGVFLVRQHRGGFEDSMKTTVAIDRTLEALAAHINESSVFPVSPEAIEITPYGGIDKRSGWDTYMISIKNRGVFGFANGPLVTAEGRAKSKPVEDAALMARFYELIQLSRYGEQFRQALQGAVGGDRIDVNARFNAPILTIRPIFETGFIAKLGDLFQYSAAERSSMTASGRAVIDTYFNDFDVVFSSDNGVVTMTPLASSNLSPLKVKADSLRGLKAALLREVGQRP